MTPLKPLVPLLAAAAILLAGNGVQGTMVALRGVEEGFDTLVIGIMGTAYFAGYILACIYSPRLVEAVGHIRVFAALAAIASAATLALVIVIDPIAWTIIRFVMGFCFSGLFTVIESWINAASDRTDRGRVLSIYRIVDLTAVTGSQYLLPVFDPSGFELFAIVAMFFCLSLVPVSLGDRSRPRAPERFRFDLGTVWRISPLACIGCVTIGMTNTGFRFIGPLYATAMDLDISGIATFMGAGILGGAALQYPLGMISDRFDRRWTLLAATAGAVLAALFLAMTGSGEEIRIYVGIFLFGAFALPLYSLSAAHANDQAQGDQFLLLAAGLTFFFAIGAMAGPPIASYMMDLFGARALFIYMSLVHGAFIVVALWRILVGPAVPRGARKRFVMLLRTSPVIYRLAERSRSEEKR